MIYYSQTRGDLDIDYHAQADEGPRPGCVEILAVLDENGEDVLDDLNENEIDAIESAIQNQEQEY